MNSFRLYEQYSQQGNAYNPYASQHNDHADLHSDAHVDTGNQDQHSDNHQDRCNE